MKQLAAAVALLLASPLLQAEYRTVESPFVTGMQAMLDAMRDPSTDSYGRYGRYGRTDIISPFGSEGVPFESGFGLKQIAPELRVAGRWRSRSGDGLWIKDGWIRFYNRGDYNDARLIVGRTMFYVGIPETGVVTRFEYGLRGDLLALRDYAGTLYLFHRMPDPPDDDLTDEETDADDE